jgi:hypothetical protein
VVRFQAETKRLSVVDMAGHYSKFLRKPQFPSLYYMYRLQFFVLADNVIVSISNLNTNLNIEPYMQNLEFDIAGMN